MSQPGIDSKTRYFRSLDELQKTPEFQKFLDREFPQAASEFPEGVSRRRWLQLMGASLALGGLSGCRYNREEVAAFVMRPEGRIPGIPEYFATNFEWAGRVVHALVANVDGRPLKVDGNAEHPAYAKYQPKQTAENKKLASAGTDVYTQGAILSLYDQDRLGIVLNRTAAMAKPTIANSDSDDVRKQTWDAFSTHVANSAAALGTGKGLAILIEPTRSPSFWTVLKEVLKKYPEATVVKYESVYTGNIGKALDAVGATNCSMVYELDQAKVIVALDSDLLGSDPNAVQYSRQYANHRDPSGEWMNRLYCVESQYSVTGTAADFRLAMQASQIEALLSRIEKAIDAGTIVDDKVESTTFENLDADGKISRMIECIASDLLANKGSAVLAVGAHHSLAAQVAAIRINNKLGNVGKTVKIYENPADINSIKSMKLDDFVVDVLEKSSFNSLWVLAPNPVFSVSGDVNLSGAMKKIADVVYLSHYDDETAYYANWTVPANHPLESWGDVRATDGTLSICQPTIAPLLGGKTATELLAMLAGLSAESLPGNVIIAETAEKLFGKDTTVKRSNEQIANLRKMREALHAGFVAGSESKLYQGALKADPKELTAESEKEIGSKLSARNYMLPDTKLSLALDMGSVEVLVLPSDTIYDGRLGNNGWLQECPHPVTKLTWDNAAICSPATAKAMGLKQGELVVLSLGDSKVKLPLFVVPGHAEGSFTVNYGYGHSKQFGGSISGAVGTDLSTFRRWNQASIYTGVSVKPTGEPYRLATTQDHFALDDLGLSETAKRAPQLIREGTYFEYKDNPEFTKSVVDIHTGPSLWSEPEVDQKHKWGMAIDLNKCTGCNSCVVACQAENNVPIVGKEQVLRGREMHWLRIDRYFQADVTSAKSQAGINQPLDAKVVMQPMACAHCETAPCEQVCPVAATVHTEEGINAMAYNRCIGTRYCANNCPYKVRRFNYFNYNDEYGYFYGWQDKREQASKKLQSLVLNPEVTVRGRGVMEKCTYCIQRVQNGKIYARSKGDGLVHDGDIRSACQDACPTGAIVFGDLNDKTSRVHSLHEDPRSYAVLEELNIKPRTLYLSRIRNVPKRLATESQLSPARPGHGHEHGHNH